MESSKHNECRGDSSRGKNRSVFFFNPHAEGYIAKGDAFTPVQHQVKLAADLENLPQFLCEPHDVLLVHRQPSESFLRGLNATSIPVPEFIELNGGRIAPDWAVLQKPLGTLRPWAWGPDSVQLFEPLFARVADARKRPADYFNPRIAALYSKAWSADFLRKVLSEVRGLPGVAEFLCSEQETGRAVRSLDEALHQVSLIRSRGHHRVVLKEALGLAGHNALRLWEPEILPAQRQWLSHARRETPVLVEPWLERQVDFSVQLEMKPNGLELCGYTGLVTDLRGQYLANWVAPGCRDSPPEKVLSFLGPARDSSSFVKAVYAQILSMLEVELKACQYLGPVSIDAFVYSTPAGHSRLKPVVEINPRYTMGRLALELMRHTAPGTCGVFRLVNRALLRAEAFADFQSYAGACTERNPLQFSDGSERKIRGGTLILNDADRAQVCLATFEISPKLPGATATFLERQGSLRPT